MQNLGTTGGDACPFSFNFDAVSFKPGDMVSYRIPDRFDDFPFVGTLLEVHADHLLISPNDPTMPDKRMRGSRPGHSAGLGGRPDCRTADPRAAGRVTILNRTEPPT